MKKLLLWLLIVLLTVSMVATFSLAGCKGKEVVEEVAVEEPVVEEPAVEEPVEEKVGPFTIGISNSFIGSEYRTQMISVLEEINAEFMAQGLTNELVIESEDTDVAGQIRQIETLIMRGVDAILINPGDVEGLNLSLEEAVDEGIIVFAVDQEIGARGVYNVAINQKVWAMTSAEWFVEAIGGEGDVVLIEGFVGHPANVARMEGVEEVFADYPDINVVGRDTGMWDQATAQGVMSSFLASFPDLDGYWTQDGMAFGSLQAVMAADVDPWPIGTGEARMDFMHHWNELLETRPDFETIAVANPPGVAGSALRIVVEMLKGGEIDETKLEGPWGNTFYMPIPCVVTPDNFEEVYAKYADYPGSYLLDGILTQEEVMQFFK